MALFFLIILGDKSGTIKAQNQNGSQLLEKGIKYYKNEKFRRERKQDKTDNLHRDVSQWLGACTSIIKVVRFVPVQS